MINILNLNLLESLDGSETQYTKYNMIKSTVTSQLLLLYRTRFRHIQTENSNSQRIVNFDFPVTIARNNL